MHQPDSQQSVRQIIEARNADLMKWYAAGDIDSVVTAFTEDARQMPSNAVPIVGREAIRRFWKDAVKNGTWTFTLSTQAVTTSGPLAVERGTYVLNFAPGPNAPATMPGFTDRGNYLVEWRLEGGGWLIVNDLAASEPATK